MIIVKFFSGIGNQLYQYAVYLRLRSKYPNQVIKADLLTFKNDEILNRGNGFSYGFALKDFFNIDIPIATIDEVKNVSHEMYFSDFSQKFFPEFVKKNSGNSKLANRRALLFRKYRRLRENYITNVPFEAYTGYLDELDDNGSYYVSGLWQNYEYIRPIEKSLRDSLQFNLNVSNEIKMLATEIEKTNSVCIHVRRGNFTSSGNKYTHDLCGLEYYKKALNFIKGKVENPHFFVFSDDIKYCKDNFSNIQNITFVSGNDALSTKDEMYLISKCKSAVIPNSTFAFWCVWLSDNSRKLVVAPKYSVREKTIWHEFSLPEHWIKIDNLKETD